jgi:hypothetical protein
MAKIFCIKKYYHHRAKNQIKQWLFIAGVSILFLGTFATCDALAASYVDINGASKNLCASAPTICDAGTLDFSADPPIDAKPKAQLYSTGEPEDFELRGWLWDTNLGWISLYCPESGVNLGVSCRPSGSTVTYGVKVNLAQEILYGWAWGDNIGWISFNCKSGRNETLVCGAKDYTSNLEIDVTKSIGEFSGYAWADSVGWFDLSGVSGKILDIVMTENASEQNWGVWTKGEIEDNTAEGKFEETQNRKYFPIADGNNGYDLFVHVATITGTPVVDVPGQVDVDITTIWTDNVSLDQTAPDPTAPPEGRYAYLNKAGAVFKPGIPGSDLVYTADSTTGGITNSYHGVATSVAPTDGGNCWDGDLDGSCYTGDSNYFYKNFGTDIPNQILKYEGAVITVTVIPTGEVWNTTIQPLGYPGGKLMEFLPLVELPVLNFMLPGNPPIPVNIIQATRNKEDIFNIQGKLNAAFGGTYEIILDLIQDNPNVYYQFIQDLNTVPVAEKPIPPLAFKNSLPFGDYYSIPFVPDIQLAEEITGAMIRSTINLPDLGVKYFNNGLPRTDESIILNQSAEIVSGSVFSPGAKEVTTGAEVPLFGDTAVYELRTQILEDVSGLIRGIEPAGLGGDFTIENGMSETELDNYALQGGRAYYFKDHNVYLDSTDPLTSVVSDRPITLVVEGGDIYVNTNIDTGKAFGLIALSSRTDDSEATGGGHIYVHGDVTDMVDVSIFSDGPMFRYTDGICYYWGPDGSGNDSLRAPNFVNSAGWCSSAGSYKEPVSALPNQFYLRGNVASLNCIGCSAGLAPTRGDGKLLGGPSAENYSDARLYDFNYFSYYREDPLSPGTFPGAESYTVQASGIIPPAKKNMPVYFEYSPAPSDLLGFRVY